jgi:TfoX/Sxy family transcriptional regulator of competence genes
MRKAMVAAGLLLAAGGAAQAQVIYQCRAANGAVYQSSRPCTGQSVGAYAPPVERQPPPTYYYYSSPSSVDRAPEYLRHMSARCASLHDALRTASTRGLKYETIATMRQDYQRECAEDEMQARQLMSREQFDKRLAQRADIQAQQQAEAQTKAQQQQCAESRRVLYVKKQRTDLTEGERADLARFEENLKSRCGG